jgi:NTE family protein
MIDVRVHMREAMIVRIGPSDGRQRPEVWRSLLRAAAIMFATGLSACATIQPAQNPPALPANAAGTSHVAEYRAQNLQRGDNSDTLLLSMTFSGGGMRSAAASYFLLDALRQQQVRIDGRDKPLLHEIDFISSVSGGSFTAAYYALYRDRLFTDYLPQVIRRDMQGELIAGLFKPRNAWRLGSDTYGRGDYLAEHLDRILFAGKTFADLPRERPFLRIGAADMLTGKRVEFTQDGFDQLCSRVDAMPIARAVAASAAVPGIFSPINVADYSADCVNAGSTPPRYRHLVDGGVADNLGISGTLQAVGRYSSVVDAMRTIGFRGVRHIAIVILNVENTNTAQTDGTASIPSLRRTISAAIDGNMHTDSEEITETLRRRIVEWKRQIAEDPRAVADNIYATPTPDVFLIEIGFAQVPDPALRARLQSIPTALRVSREDEALLGDFVRAALQRSPEYRSLLESLAREASAVQ